MPTKTQESFVIPGGTLYSETAADGPEIGTLVLVVDRAKNLPNLKTIGKQDPYCAVRLGKEAKKTTTDIRGGQTPRWYVAAYAPFKPITSNSNPPCLQGPGAPIQGLRLPRLPPAQGLHLQRRQENRVDWRGLG